VNVGEWMSNVINYYNKFDEWGRLDREPIEFQVNSYYMKKYMPPNGNVLDNGAGPGKYALEFAKDGYTVTLTDLTPKLVEIAEKKAQEQGLINQFNGFHVADAQDLIDIKDAQFDASLLLGPMYHLQQESERIKAIKELNRVTKDKGIIFVAFMSRTKHIFSSLMSPENWKPNNNMDSINQFSHTGYFNHADENRFTGAYYFNIEDIKPFMEEQGFESVELIGSNVGAILNNEHWNYWRDKGEQEVEKIIQLLIEKAGDPHILGLSSHLLYIGRKK
jgi:ubiquinone/menaquinone biosynthesis C-methylase UbiE